jgi:hypothetical protein
MRVRMCLITETFTAQAAQLGHLFRQVAPRMCSERAAGAQLADACCKLRSAAHSGGCSITRFAGCQLQRFGRRLASSSRVVGNLGDQAFGRHGTTREAASPESRRRRALEWSICALICAGVLSASHSVSILLSTTTASPDVFRDQVLTPDRQVGLGHPMSAAKMNTRHAPENQMDGITLVSLPDMLSLLVSRNFQAPLLSSGWQC